MSHNPNKLLTLTAEYAEFAESSLTKLAKEVLDPKAKVRNRGTVCIPAESAKDKKDHFPINDEAQARNALSQVGKYTAVPAWYSGSLEGLKKAIRSKVHAKYPSIKEAPVAKKKSFLMHDFLIAKYGQSVNDGFYAAWNVFYSACKALSVSESYVPNFSSLTTISTTIQPKVESIRKEYMAGGLSPEEVNSQLVALLGNNPGTTLKTLMDTSERTIKGKLPGYDADAKVREQMKAVFDAAGSLISFMVKEAQTASQNPEKSSAGLRKQDQNAEPEKDRIGPPAPPSGTGGRTIKPIDYRKDPELVAGVRAATDWMAQTGAKGYLDVFNQIKANLDGNQSADVLYKYLQKASTMTGDPATESKIKASMKYMMDRYGPNSKNWNPATPYTAPSTVGAPGAAKSEAPDTYQSTGNPIPKS